MPLQNDLRYAGIEETSWWVLGMEGIEFGLPQKLRVGR